MTLPNPPNDRDTPDSLTTSCSQALRSVDLDERRTRSAHAAAQQAPELNRRLEGSSVATLHLLPFSPHEARGPSPRLRPSVSIRRCRR